MNTMQGRRLPDGEQEPEWYEPGGYAKDTPTGWWYICTPNGLLGTLRQHTVVEHDDGTITVSPSILVRGAAGKQYHGWLERGVWREA